jgi:hypothetical protein
MQSIKFDLYFKDDLHIINYLWPTALRTHGLPPRGHLNEGVLLRKAVDLPCDSTNKGTIFSVASVGLICQRN